MKIKIFLIFFLAVAAFIFVKTNLFSQSTDFNHFTTLLSSAPVPSDFQSDFLELLNEDKNLINASQSEFDKKHSERFIVSSNYVISQLLQSGKVIFNDAISNYISKVADSLLKPFPELRRELRFYTVKSPEVNAYSTDKGIVFVNIGLISRLKNEAELAFILAHEIVHYAKKHNINLFLENEKIDRRRAEYKGLNLKEKVFMKHYRSKEYESEADKLGFVEYYSKSPYSTAIYNDVFDLLQFAELPIAQQKFDKSLLESEYLKIPEKYTLEKVKPVLNDENADDTLETHPNIVKRRAEIKAIIDKNDSSCKKLFVNSESEFIYCRNLARFECLRQWMIDCNYEKAFVNAAIMLSEFPENEYLQSVIAWSLYGFVKYKNTGELNSVLSPYNKVEGESQQLNYLFTMLNTNEMCVVAINYVWRLYKKYPENNYYKQLSVNLFDELVSVNELTINDFVSITNEVSKNDSTYIYVKTSKNSKLNSSFANIALIDLFQDEEFRNAFNVAQLNKRNIYEKYTFINRFLNKPLSLGIDKVVFVDPFCIYLDERKEDIIRYIDSYDLLNDYKIKMKDFSELLHLNAVILENSNISEHSTNEYNDLCLIKEWFSERFNHGDMRFYEFTVCDAAYLSDKYQTPYFCWTGFYSARLKPNISNRILSALIYSVLLSPLSIVLFIGPEYETQFYTFLFDITNGETKMADIRYVPRRASKAYLSSNIYDILYQINRK